MKNLFFCSLLTLIAFTANAQILQGKYSNEREYLKFEGDTVMYYFQLGCCLVNEYKGTGKWYVKNNKLLIEDIQNEQSTITTAPSVNNDSLYFRIEIEDTSRYLMPWVTFLNSNNSKIGIAANCRQIALLKKTIKNFDSLSIQLDGYLSINCKLNSSLDYSIKLAKGNDLSYLEPVLKLSKGGLPCKIKKNKLVIKRLVNEGHEVFNKNVVYQIQE